MTFSLVVHGLVAIHDAPSTWLDVENSPEGVNESNSRLFRNSEIKAKKNDKGGKKEEESNQMSCH